MRYLLIFAVLLFMSHPSFGDLIEEISSDLRQVTEELWSRFPTKRYYPLCVGRSLGTLALYQTAWLPGSNSALPVSWMGFLGEKFLYDPPAINSSFFQEHLDALFEHYEKMLPSPEVLGDRILLPYDYARSGFTLYAIWKTLELFFQKQGTRVRVEPLAFIDSKTEKWITWPNTIDLRGYPTLLQKIHDGALKKIVEFPEPFRPRLERGMTPQRNPQFGELLKRIKELSEGPLERCAELLKRGEP